MPTKVSAKKASKKNEALVFPKKVLVLGSGALKIGEAGEFDYSGSQAIKALKEEGVESILVNPNIATIQTSKGLADKVYFLPVNAEFVEKVIEKEKPDGLFLAFGGQTALNCGVDLWEKGVLKKHGVKVYGTQPQVIMDTEDRELFKKKLEEIDIKSPVSFACTTRDEAFDAAKKIGYPVIIRAAFALGGKGSGFADNEKELAELCETAFAFSPQVLVEENLKGWKEVEYEVVRDGADNCVTVCNMENFDPLGIHTGESIVVAPSQTLNNHEYHKLRRIAIDVIRHLGIVGECNIQYALDPKSDDYRVIEVNARLSRSSALASKATGYPLAHVAAKLALGYNLPDLKNAVTKTTTAFFEPALDYLALKIPRWDLNKFRMVSKEITSEMKSVGEIMALGRSFEEVLQKGLRMLQVGLHGLVANEDVKIRSDRLREDIEKPTPKRILVIAQALKEGVTVEEIAEWSGIDRWFLDKIKNIIDLEKEVEKSGKEVLAGEDAVLLRDAKLKGFSDKQIGFSIGKEELEVRKARQKKGIVPYVKQIDTLAAEYPAKTNYLYLSYHGDKHDVEFGMDKKAKAGRKMIVLGSGAYCIGSSVEFDWCCVNALQTCGREGFETIMINYNPETVSTDYDLCDKLYFDELSLERVMDIYELESGGGKSDHVAGVVVSTGGQVPNNLALKLYKAGARILGTSPENIDRAEDRHKFSGMLDKLGIDQPQWKELAEMEDVFGFVDEVGYPALVRPSYVLSGAAMSVAYTREDLETFLGKAAKISKDAPVVISKFETGAKEIEIDAVASDGKLVVYAIAEHIENAGVHSGDATIVLPPQKLYIETIRRIKVITKKIAQELHISGPFNIQFLAKNNRVMVIECNLRSSRSFPFSSKVTGYNFIEIATESMINAGAQSNTKGGNLALKIGERGRDLLAFREYRTLDLDHVGVKAPQFSFPRLKGADPVLGVEMASTGEVACFGDDLEEAFLKSMISVGFVLPQALKKSTDGKGGGRGGILFSIGGLEEKADLLPTAAKFAEMGFKIYGTPGTADFFNKNGVDADKVYKVSSGEEPNLLGAMADGRFELIVNIPKHYSRATATDGYLIRRKSIDLNIPLITNVQVARIMAEALGKYGVEDLKVKNVEEYF
ncbi:carbamoyl-phosphate synthase (glutamine-hydrolyzing) large subunit [Candidatus Peregrinibacteria bacterium]|nr:carbamoyl-phosphate synthase (glutamine-hydrolyzing) large subunit [Candidatus Peregrinibacteria bacterium]